LILSKKFAKLFVSAAPLLIISGLLYAGFFVKPSPRQQMVKDVVFDRGDRYYGLSTTDGISLWLVGSDGKILKTNDAGVSWEKLDSGIKSGLQDVAVWNEKQAIVVGNGPKVLRTEDGGQTWRGVELPKREMATKLLRVKAMPGGGAWAVGEAGMVLRSQDFGLGWRLVGNAEDVAWNDISFVGNKGWLVGEFGRIKVTSDGGSTWDAVVSPVKNSLMSVAFRNDRDGLAVGLKGVILGSVDGGRHWEVIKSPTDEHLFGVIWDGKRWVVVGDKGIALVGGDTKNDWQVMRTEPNDRSWHVNLASGGDKYFLVGANFAVVNQKDWQFTGGQK
jgi:photosystem II stability/assembly factor-like uncharacterized protein